MACAHDTLVATMALVLLASGVGFVEMNDACMAGATNGLTLSWWLQVNCVIVQMMFFPMLVSCCSRSRTRCLVYYEAIFACILLLPWHVVGLFIAYTSQKACFSQSRLVGIVFACMYAYDAVGILVLVQRSVDIQMKARHRRRELLCCFKYSVWISLFVVLVSGALIVIAASNLADACLVDDPTGVNIAQWELIMGCASLLAVVISGAFLACQRMPAGDKNGRVELREIELAEMQRPHLDELIAGTVKLWVFFIIVWVSYGLFLVANTQRGCVNGSAPLTTGFVLSVVILPLAAIGIINHYTERFWREGLMRPADGGGGSYTPVVMSQNT